MCEVVQRCDGSLSCAQSGIEGHLVCYCCILVYRMDQVVIKVQVSDHRFVSNQVVVLYGVLRCFSGFKTKDYSYPANTLPPMFSHGSSVVDITNGSMDALKYIISHEPINIVLYYAPWCHLSRKVAHNFEQAAETMKDEVTKEPPEIAFVNYLKLISAGKIYCH